MNVPLAEIEKERDNGKYDFYPVRVSFHHKNMHQSLQTGSRLPSQKNLSVQRTKGKQFLRPPSRTQEPGQVLEVRLPFLDIHLAEWRPHVWGRIGFGLHPGLRNL